jgi:putative ATP-dependent endonuclease of OLD family
MNILVGENDSGKTSVIDAIRYVLWTTSYEFIRLFETDFHIKRNAASCDCGTHTTYKRKTRK